MTWLLWLLAAVPAIVLHEVAHARVADWLGDPTARRMGRCSLNPLAHFTRWYVKPVHVHYAMLGRKGALVALAGPACNLLQAGVWSLVPGEFALASMWVNLAMVVMNLLTSDGPMAWRCARGAYA